VSQTTQSPLDKEPYFTLIKGLVEGGETNASIVRTLPSELGPVSESSIRRFRKRHELQVPGQTGAYTRVDNNVAEAATASETTKPILTDPDTMLRERGLDPEDWVITHMSPNMYEGPPSKEIAKATGQTKVTYYQTKFTATRRRPPELQIIAPRTDGWKAPPRTRWLKHDGPKLIVVVGDQQAPFHDPQLHRLFCSFLRKNKPQEGISLGDSVDFPDISRHQLDPENTATVNECLQAGYDLFRGYVDSSPETFWRKLYGNHDERIRNLILDKPKNQPLYGLKRPDTPEGKGEQVLELSHLMRLDELGVELVLPSGGYELGQIRLTNKLAVRHGWLARKGSGASALATLEHLGYSVIVGHTHRQAVVHETKHEIDGKLRTITGVEAGCMCRVDQTPDEDGRIWPNYTAAPDWQQGFATVEVWPDGYFNIDTAKYVNGALMWRDQRYTV
jgi:hypothetical protein